LEEGEKEEERREGVDGEVGSRGGREEKLKEERQEDQRRRRSRKSSPERPEKPGLYFMMREAPYQITTATTPFLMGLPLDVSISPVYIAYARLAVCDISLGFGARLGVKEATQKLGS
jgi:hypothetical protein